MAIGGSSSDPTLVASSNVPNAFVIFVMSGGVQKWIKSFNDIYNEVTSIVVQSGDSRIMAAMDSTSTKP